MNTITSKSGKTITLRPPTMDDIEIMLDYINGIGREDIYTNVNPNDLYTLEQEEFFVKDIVTKIERKKAVYYLAFHHDQLIGSVSVICQDKRQSHVAVFGITLIKDYRSDGIGEQLSQFIFDQAAKSLEIRLIILNVFEPNHIAYNLYKKLGFIEYGRLPKGLSYKGEYIDSILMYKKA